MFWTETKEFQDFFCTERRGYSRYLAWDHGKAWTGKNWVYIPHLPPYVAYQQFTYPLCGSELCFVGTSLKTLFSEGWKIAHFFHKDVCEFTLLETKGCWPVEPHMWIQIILLTIRCLAIFPFHKEISTKRKVGWTLPPTPLPHTPPPTAKKKRMFADCFLGVHFWESKG